MEVKPRVKVAVSGLNFVIEMFLKSDLYHRGTHFSLSIHSGIFFGF